eukprot:TRINITY_DN35300_c0_g1_i1.p1 TRINITY_DN35300_c0_g1~~TRINITY_DN35300_c0_g1_i1.p1  ORF type:complete len:161 (+),score=51.46 TRINITY_DN35300_c0_g1_i1:75-485(+)
MEEALFQLEKNRLYEECDSNTTGSLCSDEEALENCSRCSSKSTGGFGPGTLKFQEFQASLKPILPLPSTPALRPAKGPEIDVQPMELPEAFAPEALQERQGFSGLTAAAGHLCDVELEDARKPIFSSILNSVLSKS